MALLCGWVYNAVCIYALLLDTFYEKSKNMLFNFTCIMLPEQKTYDRFLTGYNLSVTGYGKNQFHDPEL